MSIIYVRKARREGSQLVMAKGGEMKFKPILLIAVLMFASSAIAQSPQGAVGPSYKQCPPDTDYDPKDTDRYIEFEQNYGSENDPQECVEVVDKHQPGWCQIRFYCKET